MLYEITVRLKRSLRGWLASRVRRTCVELVTEIDNIAHRPF